MPGMPSRSSHGCYPYESGFPDNSRGTQLCTSPSTFSEDIARQFALNPEGFSRAALEALALEGARAGKVTTEQVCSLLGFATRYDADGFLKLHEVYYPLTREDVQRDAVLAWEFSQCSSSPTPPRSTT
jgi:hypothetical protein